MRFLIVAVGVLAFASSAFAQNPPAAQTPPAVQAPPSLATGAGLDAMRKEHENWFTEPNTYKPCPSSVVFPDGRPACLGCPTSCPWHLPRR